MDLILYKALDNDTRKRYDALKKEAENVRQNRHDAYTEIEMERCVAWETWRDEAFGLIWYWWSGPFLMFSLVYGVLTWQLSVTYIVKCVFGAGLPLLILYLFATCCTVDF